MRSLLISSLFLLACGATQFNTRDPYADAGTQAAEDAGATGGGGGAATGGGGGAVTGGGGGSTTGGGGGGSATGGGGGASCSAATCANGCCANGVCQAGTSNAQCGKGGVACAVCPSATDVCKADQTCGIDPASTWRVRPSSAVISSFAWDDLSPPDIELELWCPATATNATAVMPKVSDSYMPSWSSGGCTLTAAQALSAGFAWDAYDVDITALEEVAARQVEVLTESELRAGSVTVSNGGVQSMTVTLIKQ
jgi:hypothetical protein